MSTVYPVPTEIANVAHIDAALYQEMYAESIENPDTFWSTQANAFLSWDSPQLSKPGRSPGSETQR